MSRHLAGIFLLVAATLSAADRSRPSTASPDDTLTGTWGGRRAALAQRGIEPSFTHTSAIYSSVAGGRERGTTVEGTGDLGLDLDLGKLAGWPGARVRVSGVFAHGPDISARYVGDANIISDYAITEGVYLHECWLEQSWLDQRVSLRVGKLSADVEFPVYQYADTMPLPLFPVGALGARLRIAPAAAFFFEAGLWDGDPTEPGRGLNRHGVHVRLARSEGATVIASLGLNVGAGPLAALPAGTWKLGVYHSTRTYRDVLAGPPHRGNHALFLNGDQTLWRENPTVKDDAQGLGLYFVAETAPPDRNTFHYGFGGGPYYTGLFPGRDHDLLYLNFLYSRFSARASRASVAAGGPPYFFENALQVYYKIAVRKFWSLQPQVDYVVKTGGTGLLPSATVMSLRSTLVF